MIQTSWEKLIARESEKEYFQKLKQFLRQEYATKTIFPAKKDMMACFEYTDLEDVKVVIIGQDPYHGPNQAHGLSFSVKKGVALPKSLQNIYKELASDVKMIPPLHGDLTKWAKEGVLLLNTTLTVVAKQPLSHVKKGWETFTKEVILTLNAHPQPKVFMLWGKHAQSLESYISNPVHLILKTVHPSPLSAYRGFLGCKHFSKANLFLQDNQRQPIDWQL